MNEFFIVLIILSWVWLGFMSEVMFVWFLQRAYPEVTDRFWKEFDWITCLIAILVGPFAFASVYFKYHGASR